MNSLWNEYPEKISFPKLTENIKTDVLIIGGGLAGLLCAHKLKNNGVDCVLLEAKTICSGITCNTTAKITLQHGLIYHKLINNIGEENARLYLSAQIKALDEYENLCKSIECDYEKKDSYVYSLSDKNKIEKETDALMRLGVDADFCYVQNLPFETAGAVRVKNQAQFHPLKFAYKIAENLPIYENTKILEFGKGKLITDCTEISCKKIIVATHFPIFNKHGMFFLKMYQHRSYVLALEGAEDLNGMYVDEDEKGLSFRNYKNLLLIGGGSHRTGKKGGSFQEIEAFANKYYKNAIPVNRWATQDCMTLDKIPYVGHYSKNTPDLFVATGFNKWGMTSSMISAIILSDLVCEKQNEYSSLFSPLRSILHPQLAVNTFESLKGILTPTTPRCPHLGCALKYNPQERSWDCPCHGSRFSEDGELIDNPATDDKKNI